MQIVIDIDDERYKDIQRIATVQLKGRTPTLEQAIASGTPLPKGHGRLGDLDELEQRISNFIEYDASITDEYTVARQRFIVDGIRQTPTIIEADKAESEG